MNKKLIYGGLGVLTFLGVVGAANTHSTAQVAGTQIQVSVPPVQTTLPASTIAVSPSASVITPSAISAKTPIPHNNVMPPPSATSNELSNDNYYTNSEGDTVHSPAYADTIPAGATAKCADGTYSLSENHRGTCSHHGGVEEFYK